MKNIFTLRTFAGVVVLAAAAVFASPALAQSGINYGHPTYASSQLKRSYGSYSHPTYSNRQNYVRGYTSANSPQTSTGFDNYYPSNFVTENSPAIYDSGTNFTTSRVLYRRGWSNSCGR